jgi:PPK2 family polyphosphate:nucleotide phosphotransferase
LLEPFTITDGRKFRLQDVDPDDTRGVESKTRGAERLASGVERLRELQGKLYAQGTWALLLIFQAMDAAGKDSTISHVMSGVNPQGCRVHSFKAPSSEDLAHDFLWRTTCRLPERGHIGIFNRSYYEEVLVVRVHPEILANEKLPPELVTGKIWQHRFKDIRAFERYLTRNGIAILKFHLRISKEEQRRRLLARLDEPAKRWKFSMHDIAERKLWDKYMAAYEDMIRHTSTPEAPWHVVPTDHKWFAHLAIAATIVDRLERLNLQFPKVEGAALAEMRKVRKALMAERPGRGRH